MKAVYCPYCGGRTKRNGRTSSGSQRWRCTACGASTTVRYDDTATRLDEFLGWLLSKDSQAAMPGGGRSFRRRTAEFWEVWPMPVPDGELHRVLYVDGIWVARDLVVLICCSGERVVSWYMARSENSRAWSALMAPIPAPDVVVTDGGSGFAKAVRETWPRTRVQRCTFHAFSQVKRYTTTRPKLQAGRELYLIARDLMGIETLHQAELWVERYLDWCGFWADFLEDRTVVDGRRVYTLLASIYFSPFSPTYFRQSRQRGCAGFANADAPLSASRLPPPSRPHRRWIRPSGGTTVPLS